MDSILMKRVIVRSLSKWYFTTSNHLTCGRGAPPSGFLGD